MIAKPLPNATILVVDDEQANLDLLADCLASEGYSNVTCLSDSREVMAAYESLGPDLILLDLHMPEPDGFEILRLLGERVSDDEYLPILVLTADVNEATKERALSGGATDFLTKPLNLSEAVLRIGNLLHTRFLHKQQKLARRSAEDAERRAVFLADASRVLATSLDHHTTLSVLSRTAVPRIADYCVIDLRRDDGTIVRVGAAHIDPAGELLLRQIVEGASGSLWADNPAYADLAADRLVLLDGEGAASSGAPVISDGAEGNGLLNPRSLVIVPLLATGMVHGALVLAMSTSGRGYGRDDLELARELARRAALTIENARLYSQALEATVARDELLAIVAHDLRNPLSTVTMGSGLLAEEAESPKQRQYVELIQRAAERMNRLIEDLLEAARVQNRKLRVDPRPEAPATVVKEAVATLRPLAEARGIGLEARVSSDLPLVMMDSARIQQVLSNLVGNALKFTPRGGRIEISCEEMEDEVWFSVIDTGPGIPPEQIPQLFGRFWQANDRDSRGIGLGLSIVRGIVETHGGRVWVESELGSGATFFFTLSTVSEALVPTGSSQSAAAPALD